MPSSTKPQPVQVTDAELRQAFVVCRGRKWPATFEEAMADDVRARIITACAHGLHDKARRTAVPTCTAPLPQQPLVPHWPPKAASFGARRAMPAGQDRKRAAAGDRDDD